MTRRKRDSHYTSRRHSKIEASTYSTVKDISRSSPVSSASYLTSPGALSRRASPGAAMGSLFARRRWIGTSSSAIAQPSRTKSTRCLPGTTIKVMKVRFQQRMPFVIYAECEALWTPHDVRRGEAKFYSHHDPCSIGYKLVTDLPVLADELCQSHRGRSGGLVQTSNAGP